MNRKGLNNQQVEESRKKYGGNNLTQISPDPLWKKILEGFKDPMIMILLVALAVQVVLFFLGQAEWFEPVGILIAILIANGVASISESKQEGKASALKAEEEAKETAKVIRDGKLHCKVLFRSNDACKAAFMNAFALIMLQKRFADELGVEMGTYSHRANSFHCYEKDFEMLNGYVKRIEAAQDEYDICFDYEDGWKEDMEAAQAEIAQKVEELRNR